MSPGCQIDGKARHEWLDDEIEMEFGDSGTLHDVMRQLVFMVPSSNAALGPVEFKTIPEIRIEKEATP